MSISPTDAPKRSTASPPFRSSPNPCSRHGPRQDPRRPFEPWSEGIPCGAARSAPVSASELVGPPPSESCESTSRAGESSHIPSKKVIKYRVNGIKKGPNGLKQGTNIECQAIGREEIPLHCQSYQFGLAQRNERPYLNANLLLPENSTSGPSCILQGNASQFATRRSNVINANHLLNFHFDPISRPAPKPLPPRRQHKIKPYNKDLFLQANYKFVVFDRGGYEVELIDPDKMLNWEDVICVRYTTPFTVQCPICLETPLCPQITTCGHIYCFPCILCYMLMGEETHKGESWKKCPLCFMMISTKDLYTVFIESVKHCSVGDYANFTLLNRPKDSVFPVPKSKQVDSISCSSGGLCDSFSKFILTSDVELSVREPKSDLYFWLDKADSGLVDDMEKLPYVCAALEQLEERMKIWGVQRTHNNNPVGDLVSLSLNAKASHSPKNKDPCSPSLTTNSRGAKSYADEPGSRIQFHHPDYTAYSITVCSDSPPPVVAESELLDVFKKVPISQDEDDNLQLEDKTSQQNAISSSGITERDSYTFYQATDGQHLILHPLNMKCLLHHYGSYDMLPPSISGEILELETVIQSEAIRKRYRFLSHFSLTTTFQICEIDLRPLLPPSSLAPFVDEIIKREKRRQRISKKEEDEKAKGEAVSYINLKPSAERQLSHKDVLFSLDDFEALTTSSVPSTSPPAGERKLFSDVTRLGYASAHDSPSLRVEEAADLSAPRNMTTLSFATILSSTPDVEGSEHNSNVLGKKGKKPNRVLLSNSGGRRY